MRTNTNMSNDSNNNKLDFHYIKSSSFQTHYVDGVNGSLIGNGNVSFNFFVERSPIPNKITVADNDIMEVTGKNGIIREVQASIILNQDMAKQLYGWLGSFIEDKKDDHE